MKRLIIALFTITSFSLFAQGVPNEPEEVAPKNPVTFHAPKPIESKLSNGMKVIMIPDKELPLIDLQILVPGGRINEPAGRVGVASITTSLIRSGGTKSHTADAIDEILESHAIEIDAGANKEYSTITFSCLSKDMDLALSLLSEMITEPAFDESRLEVERNKLSEEVRRQNDEPFKVAFREFSKIIYGAESPWARKPTIESLASIKKEDCLKFYGSYCNPDSAILSISGRFEPDGMLKSLENSFKKWKKRNSALLAAVPVVKDFHNGTYLADKEVNQTTFIMGCLTGKRFENSKFNTDTYAIDVLNFILGGESFNSRLMREIRSNKGLAYGAYSYFSLETDLGNFAAFCQTKVPSTIEAMQIMRDEIEKLYKEPVPEKELEDAKRTIISQYVFNYDSPKKIVDRMAILKFYGYPSDYMGTYTSHISSITANDIQNTAKKYLHLNSFTTFILGPAKDLFEPLSKEGKVTKVQLPEVKEK